LGSALRNDILDILIVTSDMTFLGAMVLPLWRERIVVAFPEGHPLTDRDVVCWTDLRNETVSLSQRSPPQPLGRTLILQSEPEGPILIFCAAKLLKGDLTYSNLLLAPSWCTTPKNLRRGKDQASSQAQALYLVRSVDGVGGL
jgi:DNA-binding transcriptional LysR family regulator